ncbi:FecCD family ABC transporter permease [Phormidium tenue]|uniref:Iron ABC transporter permease n=1 Tax=Phormidium tenue NIES-30 TaxID=549789 RepID=A0A1U7J4Q5_9CYAN|nr:iron ABC transporter permease [Phormidium tenue]MBD2232797.1 iron ABC transporter permease [Phormidium tenue FACHB-1052]OKH47510.1 iron ABC transporter permease [Phormidium tenue NIES-30]
MHPSKPWLSIRPRRFPVSVRVDRRVPGVLGMLILVALLALVFNVSQGDYAVPPLEVVKTILGFPASSDYAFVVNTLRLPRALVALLVGMGLATAGTILQGLTRNPLAAPEIIGINSGASLVAVAVIVLFPQVATGWLPIAAFLGGLGAAIAIYLLAWNGGSSPMRLILIGIGLTSLTGAFTSLMITFGNIYDVSQALIWLTGSVYGRSWEHLWPLLPWLAVFLPLTLVLARDLDTLNLGDNLAQGLGSRVEWTRSLLLLCTVALAGASVATAGTIGFVGLMAPHLARNLVGPSHVGLIPAAALTGACIVELADIVGRLAFAPIELPCGVITAVIGAPYFLWLLYRDRNQ